jgi:disulfide bond formation protein DsbB
VRADRGFSLTGLLICAGALLYAVLWLQGQRGLEPCPLCVLDRVVFAAVGVVFLLSTLHAPRGRGQRVYAGLALVPIAFGLAVGGRHLWLQSLPPGQVPACGPTLGYMVDNFPLQRIVDLVLRGSGSCADIQWQFLGLSIPAWTFILFVLLALIALVLLFKPRPRRLF